MKHHYYRKCGAAHIAILDCSYKHKNKRVYINRINTPLSYQGKGIASELLRECLADADKDDVTLQLEIVPSGTLNYDELQAWYERYGFQETYLDGYEHFVVWERQPLNKESK